MSSGVVERGVPLVIAEPSGRYRRDLRRFRHGPWCDGGGYCDATVTIDIIGQAEAERLHGDNWPHEDARWPKTCARCGYEFAADDEWQRNDNLIYRLPDGTEFVTWGSRGEAPPGTMIRVPWADDHFGAESWLVILPDGGQWITTQAATGGGKWTVTGTPPQITVSPSIWHNRPHGWHGFIRSGVMSPA